MDDNLINTRAKNLTKAIFQHESGMNFDAKGDNGTTYGAGQWQPETWKSHAKIVLGDENAPMTKDNQSVVAQGMMHKWIKEGKNAAQIAALWNSGSDKGWEDKVGAKTYPDGTTIKYNVPKYVKEVTDLYQKYKTEPSQTQQTEQTQPEKRGLLSTIAHGIINPVATMVARPFQAGAELLGASAEDVDKFSKEQLGGFVEPVPQNASDVVKDIGRAGETVALGMPVGTLKGAITAGAVMGAGSGLESNPTVSGAVTGGLLGGGLGLGGGLISKLLGKLPKTLVSSAFKDLTPPEIEKALQTKTIGTSNNLLNQSQKAIADYGTQIDNLLSKSEKTGIGGVVGGGSGNDAIRQTITQFPEFNSDKGMVKMLNKIKSLIPATLPGKASRGTILGLIDKIANGTATLTEKNTVRSAIDGATKGGYAKLAKALNPSAGHDLAMTFADALRGEVQNWVPETQPIFDEFSKEIAFRNAVRQAINKGKTGILGWNDIVPYMLGSNLGGLPGGLGTVALERGASNPAVKFGLAKGTQAVGKVLKPIASRAGLLSIGQK